MDDTPFFLAELFDDDICKSTNLRKNVAKAVEMTIYLFFHLKINYA